jgi:Tol biopolymer transport system component
LLFDRIGAQRDLWYVEVDKNGNPSTEKAFLATDFDEHSPVLSPNDRFLAYVSDKSGRHEVYARTYPEGDREWVVSTNGGSQPRWRGDTREMYYVDSEGTLLAVPIRFTPDFMPGQPERLFDHTEALKINGYDVAADGKRFVVVKVWEKSRSVIRSVDNWFAELEELENGAEIAR